MKIERTQVVKIVLDEQEIHWLRQALNLVPILTVKQTLGSEAQQFLDKLWENL